MAQGAARRHRGWGAAAPREGRHRLIQTCQGVGMHRPLLLSELGGMAAAAILWRYDGGDHGALVFDGIVIVWVRLMAVQAVYVCPAMGTVQPLTGYAG